MKTIIRVLSLLVTLMVWAAPSYAQLYTISNTTLNGAITASQTTLVLTSASASTGSSFGAPAAGQCLLVDDEFMRITGVASTTMTVSRQRTATGANAHATGMVVWTAPCNAFKTIDPPSINGTSAFSKTTPGANNCSMQPAPWINVTNGNIWWCNTVNNVWSGTNFRPFTYNSVPIAQ